MSLYFMLFTYLQCYLDACYNESLSNWMLYWISLTFLFASLLSLIIGSFFFFHLW